MARPLVVLLGLAVLGSTGCRTVWVHPRADAQRYAADRSACHGQVAAGGRGDWHACMEARGWSPTLGMRWEEPFAPE